MSSAHHNAPNLRQLAATLLTQTREGKIDWVPGAPGSFIAQFRSGSMVVSSRDADGTFPYRLQALDGSGMIVATESSQFAVDEDGDEILLDPSDEAWNELVAEIFGLARRVALKIDETLSNLLGDIESGDQPAGDDDIPF